jgi:uncharacterized protein DUF4112
MEPRFEKLAKPRTGMLVGTAARVTTDAPVPRAPAGDRDIARARLFARILDDYFVDPLLGTFLPGVGDVLGSVLGLYVVALAVRRHMSPIVIARMLLNLGADTLIGLVPVLGDALDFAFRANKRNVEMLAERAASGGRAHARDWLVLLGAIAAFVGVVALVCWGVVALVRAL